VSPQARQPDADPAAQQRSFQEARVAAELGDADRECPGSDAVAANGSAFAEVVLVKGLRGPAEESGGAALSGADGEALRLALEALGYDPESCFRTLSRPEPGADLERCSRRLRMQIEAVDPAVVVALDAASATDVASAFGLKRLEPGVPIRVLGRTVLAVDGFEASLGNDREKRRVWTQLKSVARPASA